MQMLCNVIFSSEPLIFSSSEYKVFQAAYFNLDSIERLTNQVHFLLPIFCLYKAKGVFGLLHSTIKCLEIRRAARTKHHCGSVGEALNSIILPC